jgi:hypothetical protein
MAGEEKENKISNKVYFKNNLGSIQPIKYSTPPQSSISLYPSLPVGRRVGGVDPFKD